jgi:hypothetical protein
MSTLPQYAREAEDMDDFRTRVLAGRVRNTERAVAGGWAASTRSLIPRRPKGSRPAFARVRPSFGSRPSRSTWLPVTGLLRVEPTDRADHPSPLVPLATPRQSGRGQRSGCSRKPSHPMYTAGRRAGRVTDAVSFLWRWELAGVRVTRKHGA